MRSFMQLAVRQVRCGWFRCGSASGTMGGGFAVVCFELAVWVIARLAALVVTRFVWLL